MKIYTKLILRCADCPNCHYLASKFTCLAAHRNLGNFLVLCFNTPIPEWCPLKDKDGE